MCATHQIEMLHYHGRWFMCLYQELLPFNAMSPLLRKVYVSFVATLYHGCCCRMSRIHKGYGANIQTFCDAVHVFQGTIQHTTVPQLFCCRELHYTQGACPPSLRSQIATYSPYAIGTLNDQHCIPTAALGNIALQRITEP